MGAAQVKVHCQEIATGLDGQLHGLVWTLGQRANESHIDGVVLLIHGLGDHSGRFDEMAQSLLSRSLLTQTHSQRVRWAVMAFDLPGHGKSRGKPGSISSYAGLLEEIAAVRSDAIQRFGKLPHVLLGHSMGGNLAINYTLRQSQIDDASDAPTGLVLCAPMLLPPRPMPRPWIFAAWLTGHLLPFIRFGRSVDPMDLTNDAEQRAMIQQDENLHSNISMYLATQLVAQGRWAIDQARQINLPMLVMFGEDDPLIDKAACENLSIRAGECSTLVKWPKTKHAIFHDENRESVIARLAEWLVELDCKSNETSD